MEQTSNRVNIDNRAIIPEKKIIERSRKSDDLVTIDNQLFGIDKNLLITIAAVGVSLCFSMYLFKEIKKIREDVRYIKSQEPDTELIDKVEENSEAVKAIEIKLDQLITALGNRERRMQQIAQQTLKVQHDQQIQQEQHLSNIQLPEDKEEQEREHYQEKENYNQEHYNQEHYEQSHTIPVMGGRLGGTAVITLDDPDVIKI